MPKPKAGDIHPQFPDVVRMPLEVYKKKNKGRIPALHRLPLVSRPDDV